MKKISNKILAMLLLTIMLLNIAANSIYAAIEIDKGKILLKKFGSADYHLKYYREDDDEYRYLICSIVGYEDKDGKFNPTYCMNRNLTGAEDLPYNVTVDSLLDNNKVWRTIKNGYPYKSARELGLSSSYDAYAVTKWAVYCILGEAKLDYYKAEKDDKEAVAMLKALKKLVKIGQEGTEKQDDNPLIIQGLGDFKESGEYYYQEYKVTSTADFNEYKISKKNNMPKNAFIANTKGEKTATFKNDENFRVMIPKESMNKDIDLEIQISASCESYVILYGKTTVTNTQNYVVTAGKKSTATQKINLKKSVNTGKIRINKTDSETSKPIEGVEFELRDSNGKVVAKESSNKDGIVEFTGLYQGNYKIVETKPNQNYIITQTEFDVDVEYDKITFKDIQNDHKKGNLRIYKVDEENEEIGLGNVEFELYSEELQKKIGTYFTDANGEIYIENLRTGDYKLKEKSTNKWYNLINDLNIKVEWEQDKKDTQLTVKNELKKGQVKIIKVDKDNHRIKLEGVKFNVIDANGKKLETITTDSNGEAITSKYAVRDYKCIFIQEVETKQDYILNDEKIEITLEANEVSTVQIENEVKKGKIKVIKVDKDNNEIKIQGVKFEIYDENKNVVDTLITDENGEAISKDLPIISEYTIKEIKTNQEYKLNKETVKVKLDENNTTELKFENEKKKGQIKVIKIDSDNNEIKLQGVEFHVLNSKGEIVETLKTDKNGEAVTKKLPIDEKYTVVETKTLENYILSEEKITVTLKEDEIENITIKNQKIKGKIKVIKTSKDYNIITNEKTGTPLEGVEFEIYDNQNNLVDKIITDKDGIAISKELEKGTYHVKEISTNEWYLLNNEMFIAQIINNNQITELKITNESKRPDIDIEKTGPDEAEVGCEIEYDISVRNIGNTKLEDFTWHDKIPTDYIKVTKFETGTYNQNLRYNLYYKTNLSDNRYILMMEGLSSLENYKIDFEQELADNEYVTELKLEFGTVDVGFCSNDNPHLFAKVKDTVKSGEFFVNKVDIGGEINGYKVKDKSKWKTKAFKILPVTGF